MGSLIDRLTDVGQVALPTIAFGYAVYKKDYRGAAWLIASVGINQLGIEALKRVFNATRPNGKEHSFPSGHTAASFLGACFPMARYGLLMSHPLVATSMLFATLVGVGRVAANAHYPRDVVGGALLGYAVTWIVPLYLFR